MSTKVYALSREAIEKEKRRGLIRGIATAVFASGIGGGIPIIAGLAPPWIIAVLVPLFTIVFSVSFRRGLKILEENKSSFRLLAGPDFIIKKEPGVADVEIQLDHITRLEERRGAGLFISTMDKKTFIHIPEGLEGYDELKQQTLKWRPLESAGSKFEYGPLLQILAILSFGTAFAIVWLSSSLALVITAGSFVVVYMIWALVSLRRRKDIDARVKLSAWKIIFVVLAIALMVYGRIHALVVQ